RAKGDPTGCDGCRSPPDGRWCRAAHRHSPPPPPDAARDDRSLARGKRRRRTATPPPARYSRIVKSCRSGSEIMPEPVQHPAAQVLQIGELVEMMAFAGIDHQLDRRAD